MLPPANLPEAVWRRLEGQALTLDQTGQALEFDRDEIARFYYPLAQALRQRFPSPRRALVAIAGPPGSGKTALATLLAAVLNAAAGQALALVIGLDGWHYPNAYLSAHTLQRQGQSLPLRQIKGAPETFDVDAALACLQAVRRGESVVYPVYSRAQHDPLWPGGTVEPTHQMILLEGNYWLLAEPPWHPFQALFDWRLWVSADRATLIAALRERHRRGGKPPEAVEAHLQQVDLPNIDRVLRGSGPAQVVIHKASSRRLAWIEWPPA